MTDQKAIIYSALSNDATLKTLVSNRVYQFLPPKAFESPTLVFSQINNIGNYSFGNTESLEYFSFQISCYRKIGEETIDIMIQADTVMKSLGYQRQSATEFIDNDKLKAVAVYNKYV